MPFDISSIRQTTGIAPPWMVVYGTAGVGKTTFGSQAPNPVLYKRKAAKAD